MTALFPVSDGILLSAGVAGAVYTVTVAAVALTAALARDTRRRRDAREALKVLLRRRAGGR
ncbi:hypothetical protein [Streptomyces sp. 7-21]|jgi:hypothetical protein|uniref:hypothetical protein n=1 Tax=Streptomyces sp. 7-21 TaxID=2802283 RepID=UPI00191ED7C2|nr:hypothetical protein [Streptomyces sp. 7-21]MBL1067663.1 hypothetical protein [Streptomyces sp. 7-21]